MTDPRIDLKFNVDNTLYEDNKAPEEPRDWYPSSQAQELVRKFHEAFDEPIAHSPQSIGPIRGSLRSDLIKNGLDDFEKGVNNDDLLEQYDALLEIILQAYGTLVEMGVDAGPGKREVMRSKMTMLNEIFEKPKLFNVLTKQGWKPTYEEYLKHNNLKDPREVLQALAGRPEIYQEVVKFVPDQNPDADTLVSLKKGWFHNGVNYFDDEPHPFAKRSDKTSCICGKLKVDVIHYQKPEIQGEDWDIDNNAPRRKDNFHDKVMSGWEPDTATQILYEKHRQFLEYQFPSTRLVNGQLETVVYRNGEKDVDWDFVNNEPR